MGPRGRPLALKPQFVDLVDLLVGWFLPRAVARSGEVGVRPEGCHSKSKSPQLLHPKNLIWSENQSHPWGGGCFFYPKKGIFFLPLSTPLSPLKKGAFISSPNSHSQGEGYFIFGGDVSFGGGLCQNSNTFDERSLGHAVGLCSNSREVQAPPCFVRFQHTAIPILSNPK